MQYLSYKPGYNYLNDWTGYVLQINKQIIKTLVIKYYEYI